MRATKFKEFEEFLQSNEIDFKLNEQLKKHTTFKIGGPASFFVNAATVSQVQKILLKTKELNIDVFVIGNGSNLLVSDEGFPGAVLKICENDKDIKIWKNVEINGEKRNFVQCPSGAKLSKVCKVAAENSLTGLEFAFGIPGTLGGALYMNAGAYGGEMKDVVFAAVHATSDGNLVFLKNSNMKFSYRKSIYSQNDSSNSEIVILESILELKNGVETDIKAKMLDIAKRRNLKQPLDLPSAGSVFKRPEGHFVGPMIQECGLKGFSVGGAQVSTKHAGFIVNTGDATCSDVVKLINIIRESVFKKFGVHLETEFKTLGNVVGI